MEVDLVEPGALSAEFEMLTSIYELNPDGKLLVNRPGFQGGRLV